VFPPTYVGKYNKHDERHGQGKFTHADGTYEGEFKDGLPHGQGIETFADGSTTLEGTWENGVFQKGSADVARRAPRGRSQAIDFGVYPGVSAQ